MAVFTGEYVTISSVILTLLAIAMYLLLYKVKKMKNRYRKTDEKNFKNMSIGFYLGTSNIIVFLFALSYIKYFL